VNAVLTFIFPELRSASGTIERSLYKLSSDTSARLQPLFFGGAPSTCRHLAGDLIIGAAFVRLDARKAPAPARIWLTSCAFAVAVATATSSAVNIGYETAAAPGVPAGKRGGRAAAGALHPDLLALRRHRALGHHPAAIWATSTGWPSRRAPGSSSGHRCSPAGVPAARRPRRAARSPAVGAGRLALLVGAPVARDGELEPGPLVEPPGTVVAG